jgi:hypothetical protein
MGIIPAQKIKYNLHQMNKEIIHQAAQAHAENLYKPLNAQGEQCLYLLGILFRTATESIANY